MLQTITFFVIMLLSTIAWQGLCYKLGWWRNHPIICRIVAFGLGVSLVFLPITPLPYDNVIFRVILALIAGWLEMDLHNTIDKHIYSKIRREQEQKRQN